MTLNQKKSLLSNFDQRDINATFLGLFLKMLVSNDINNSRLIGLVGSFYKLFAQILVNRLKTVFGKINKS